MSISLDRSRRVTEALAGADNIVRQQGEWGLQLRCDPSLSGQWQRLVTVSPDGQPVNKSRLDAAPTTFQEAWRDLEHNRLLRVAVCYSLLFSEKTIEQVEGKERDLLVLPVYDLTESEESKSELSSGVAQKPDEAFADAVEVYIRRMSEVDPKGAARLRRAIRAGFLESDPLDFIIGCDEITRADTVNFFWPLQWMPERAAFINLNGIQADDKDGRIEAAAAAGRAAGRAVVYALRDAFQNELERSDEGDESNTMLDAVSERLFERLSQFIKPTVNVHTLPSFGGFVVLCIVAAVTLCSVVLVFQFLRLP
jgi:hypothetical protein